jgi:outer membrane protein assembly factor BamB
MKYFASLFVVALASTCFAQVDPNDPWPLERQDRWGTGLSLSGPADALFVAPYLQTILSSGWIVSHGASIAQGNLGYYGDWQPGNLHEIDTTNWSILRSVQVDPGPKFVTSVPALGINDTIFVSTDSGNISEFDRVTLTKRWTFFTNYISGSPVIGPDGDVVASTPTTTYRWQKGTGAIVWQVPLSGPGKGSAVFSRNDTRVFISHGNLVSAYRYTDGLHLWTYNAGSLTGAPSVAPNGTVIFGCDAGTIFAVTPGGGVLKWTVQTAGEVRAAAGYEDNVAYVGSYDGKMYAIKVGTGIVKWTFQSSLWCVSPPSIGHNGRIYFHNKAGDLYCLNRNGTLRWQMFLGGESRGPLTIGPDATLYVGVADGGNGLNIIRQTL